MISIQATFPKPRRSWFAAGFLTLLWSGAPAFSQSGDSPGWWGGRSSSSRNQEYRNLPEQRPYQDQRASDDRDAAKLYADARADLDSGQYGVAQRKLEVLVARYPGNPLVETARRDLQRLYTLVTPPSGPSALSSSARAVGQPSPSAGAMPAAANLPGPAARPRPADLAAQHLAMIRRATEDLRQQAGDRVFFADGSDELGTRARAALEAQAEWLRRHPGVRVTIEGHADDQGSREFNQQIADKRARAVKLRLNDLRIEAERLVAIGFARDQPVADCANPSCALQNRRAITVVTHVPLGAGFDPDEASESIAAVGTTLPPRTR